MTIEIKDRWTGKVLFTAKGATTIAAAVTMAVAAGARLDGANLDGASLNGANLNRASLNGASLDGASLNGASLNGASLDGASLNRASLNRASLDGASLYGASLYGASLNRASLYGANLNRASLDGAFISDETLRLFKADMWLTLSQSNLLHVQHLIFLLKAGKIDGSTYGDGKACACLVGSLAHADGLSGTALDHNSGRPAERWFMMIKPGDLPGAKTGGGFAAGKALEWAEGWCAAHGVPTEPDRLYAAAPDLLEACRLAVGPLGSTGPTPVYEAVLAAILKATTPKAGERG